MGIPHVHAVVIKAWADGAKIQENMYCGTTNPNKCWVDIGKNNQTILWCPKAEYRVKPEPKPDITVVKNYYVCINNNIYVDQLGEFKTQPVKYVIDGETRLIKSVELI